MSSTNLEQDTCSCSTLDTPPSMTRIDDQASLQSNATASAPTTPTDTSRAAKRVLSAQLILLRARQQLVDAWMSKQLEGGSSKAPHRHTADCDCTPPPKYRITKDDIRRWKWLVPREQCVMAKPKKHPAAPPDLETGYLAALEAHLSTVDPSRPIDLPIHPLGKERSIIVDLNHRFQGASPLGPRPLPSPHSLVELSVKSRTPKPSCYYQALIRAWTRKQPSLSSLRPRKLVGALSAKSGVRMLQPPLAPIKTDAQLA